MNQAVGFRLWPSVRCFVKEIINFINLHIGPSNVKENYRGYIIKKWISLIKTIL